MRPLLLSAEQFFDVFETYNEAIWPAQLVLGLLGLLALSAAIAGASALALFGLGAAAALFTFGLGRLLGVALA